MERDWAEGIAPELAFWNDLMATGGGAWPEEWRARLDPAAPLDAYVAAPARAMGRPRIRILDVGAGPLTCLGYRAEGFEAEITAVDPLAGDYAAALARHGLVAPIPTRHAPAEALTRHVTPGGFDIAHARNALDHAWDPLRGIRQMLACVRVGGLVLLRHFPDEAEREAHAGFHRHNFAVRDGRFVIWNAAGDIDVAAALGPDARVTVRDGSMVDVAIEKLGPGPGIDAVIAGCVAGRGFIDVGGLWGTVNERVTVALRAGAARAVMLDEQPAGNEWWSAFAARCAERGVEPDCVVGNIDDPALPDRLGRFDVVHCSGVIYHCPDPVRTLRQLRRITAGTLLLGSMTLPERVGPLDLRDGQAIAVPALAGAAREAVAAHFDGLELRVPNINAAEGLPWLLPDGAPSYAPWWWLWTPVTLAALAEAAGFVVREAFEAWEGRAHYLVCEVAA